METFSTLPPVTSGFPSQRDSNMDLWCFFVVSLNKLLNKHSIDQLFRMPWQSFDVTIMIQKMYFDYRWISYFFIGIWFSMLKPRDPYLHQWRGHNRFRWCLGAYSASTRQSITWTNADFLSNGPLYTNFGEIWNRIQPFSFSKMHMQTSSVLCPHLFKLQCVMININCALWFMNISPQCYLPVADGPTLPVVALKFS